MTMMASNMGMSMSIMPMAISVGVKTAYATFSMCISVLNDHPRDQISQADKRTFSSLETQSIHRPI
jgi:hypothetical protein